MDLKLTPTKLSGSVTPPPAKGMQHRLLILRALAGMKNEETPNMGDDVLATKRGLDALLSEKHPTINCGESGSTLRLLLPLAMAMDGAEFICSDKLLDRPLPPYAVYKKREDGWSVPGGSLRSGIFPVPGDQSAQFVSGLFFALALLDGDSTITLTTPLSAHGYIDMSIALLKEFGVTIEPAYGGYLVRGGQKYTPCECACELDWSLSAYYCVMNELGSKIDLCGMSRPSMQSEIAIEELCASMPERVNVSEVPDLVPALALLAALSPNRLTVLHHAGRLRLKETGRLKKVSSALRALGATVIYNGESLFVFGRETLRGGEVNSFGDHRVAMMAAAAATCCEQDVILHGAECVTKSYPRFFEDMKALGMKVEKIDT